MTIDEFPAQNLAITESYGIRGGLVFGTSDRVDRLTRHQQRDDSHDNRRHGETPERRCDKLKTSDPSPAT